MSAKCRVRPARMASVSSGKRGEGLHPFRFFVGRGPHLYAVALVQAVPHAHPYCLNSSSLRFYTQDAYARSTPSLSPILPCVCMKTGSPAPGPAVAFVVTRPLSSANVKSIRTFTSASVVGASRLQAFSNVIFNRGSCLSTTEFCHGHSKSVTTWTDTGVEGRHPKFGALVHDQNFRSVTRTVAMRRTLLLSCPVCVLPGGNVCRGR